MTRQYFQIGEEVLYQGTINPKLKGESVVLTVFAPGDVVRIVDGVQRVCPRDTYGYILECDELPIGSIWMQNQLKRKLDGGEDFQSLIRSFNKDKVAS